MVRIPVEDAHPGRVEREAQALLALAQRRLGALDFGGVDDHRHDVGFALERNQLRGADGEALLAGAVPERHAVGVQRPGRGEQRAEGLAGVLGDQAELGNRAAETVRAQVPGHALEGIVDVENGTVA